MFGRKSITVNTVRNMVVDEIGDLKSDVSKIDTDSFQMRLWLIVDKIDMFKAIFGEKEFSDEEEVLFKIAEEGKYRMEVDYGAEIDDNLIEQLGLNSLGKSHVVSKNREQREGVLVCGEVLKEQVDCLGSGREVEDEIKDFLSYVDRDKGINNGERLMLKVYLEGRNWGE